MPEQESTEPPGESPGSASEAETPDPEQAWKALSLVNDWIRHSEGKAGVVLATAGVAGGVLYNLVSDKHHPPCFIAVVAVLCGILIFAAGGSAAAALIPRRKIRGQLEDFNNLLYYSHIAQAYRDDAPSYEQVLKALSSDKHELTRHIANQVHANSIVADRKFTWAGRGIIILVALLVTLAILAALIGWHG